MKVGALIEALAGVLDTECIVVSEAERDLHARDESDHPPSLPDVVVFPETAEQVAAIVVVAHEAAVPVVGWGAGSSVEGHPIPVAGGIVVDFRRMNAVLAVHDADFQAVVQPGVLRLDLEEHLGRHGLFFPPDPGANATIGGMIANNASGIRAVRHGAVSANVLGLQVVLADGQIIRTGSRSIKQSAGYDLTRLFVGSEGTLGLITEATLRLAPIPEHVATAVVTFPAVRDAAAAAASIIGHGLQPAALELVHEEHVAWMIERGAALESGPSLMIEFAAGTGPAVEASLAAAGEVCSAHGSTSFRGGIGRQARAAMWRVRHGLREESRRRHPGMHRVSIDVSVPISRFAELVEFCEEAGRRAGLATRPFGHAGDGNVHLGLYHYPDDEDARRRTEDLGHEIVMKALELDGTCTGEHGVGIGKRRYMVPEHGEAAVATMRLLKHALDPSGILNPGKVLPDPS